MKTRANRIDVFRIVLTGRFMSTPAPPQRLLQVDPILSGSTGSKTQRKVLWIFHQMSIILDLHRRVRVRMQRHFGSHACLHSHFFSGFLCRHCTR